MWMPRGIGHRNGALNYNQNGTTPRTTASVVAETAQALPASHQAVSSPLELPSPPLKGCWRMSRQGIEERDNHP
ncbi:hypothetical protein NL676_018204 [Syzygium grande]|nr:hypothetical protein NL676_018204 [Syzygium grande]